MGRVEAVVCKDWMEVEYTCKTLQLGWVIDLYSKLPVSDIDSF